MGTAIVEHDETAVAVQAEQPAARSLVEQLFKPGWTSTSSIFGGVAARTR